MRSVLFLNRVYPPAEGATGQLLAELAPRLLATGWQVSVVTSRLANQASSSEMVDGVRVERVGSLPFTRASHWKRALGYLTLYPSLLRRVWRLPRADIVVTLTDPPLHLLLGPILRWLKGSRLVHWAQDIYPEVAEELGVLRMGNLLAAVLRALSTWGLRQHDAIIAVGHCMKQRLLARGLTEAGIRVIPNWADASRVFPIEHAANPFRAEHQLNGKFVVMYSGNLGLAHPFEAIIEAAERVQTARPEMEFLFVGAGSRLPWVKQQVETRRLGNVRFLPPQPLGKLAQSLSAADVHLASMREELCGLVVPSKIYGILAAGRPCVFLGPRESEAAQTILRYDCGDVLTAADGETLANCLTGWACDAGRWRTASEQAQRTARSFGVSEAAAAFDELLRHVMSPARCSQHRLVHKASSQRYLQDAVRSNQAVEAHSTLSAAHSGEGFRKQPLLLPGQRS